MLIRGRLRWTYLEAASANADALIHLYQRRHGADG
jgi:hypothetical protein